MSEPQDPIQLHNETILDFIERLRWTARLIEDTNGGPTERSIRLKNKALELEVEWFCLPPEARQNGIKH